MSHTGADPQRSLTRAAVCLLLAWLCFGVAHIACLPPWEGFDETANYSYLQQLVTTRRVPMGDEGRISNEIQRYAMIAPMPFGQVYPLTYDLFFAQPPAMQATASAFIHRRPSYRRHFVPTGEWNWEVQQPPLGYVVTVPVYLATRDLSLAAHLFSIRVVSYGFAWLALVIAAWTCARRLGPGADRSVWQWGLVGISMWPLWCQTWFPQMARFASDPLAALLGSVIFARMVTSVSTGLSLLFAIQMGVLLGAALLTKGLFVPIVPGVIGCLAWRSWTSRRRGTLKRDLLYLAVMVGVIVTVASWWYLQSWRTFDPVLIVPRTADAARLSNLTLFNIARGFAAYVATIAWTGTWSLARPPYIWLIPPAMLVVIAGAAYVNSIRRSPLLEVRWVPAWLSTPLMLGLALLIVVLRLVATNNMGNTAGRYLHFMVGPMAFGLGIGLGSMWEHPIWRRVFVALTAYAGLFGIGISWTQLLLFSGLLGKSSDKFYQAIGPLPPMFGMPEALRRLAVLAYPITGVACAGLGSVLAIVGLCLMWRAIRINTLTEG